MESGTPIDFNNLFKGQQEFIRNESNRETSHKKSSSVSTIVTGFDAMTTQQSGTPYGHKRNSSMQLSPMSSGAPTAVSSDASLGHHKRYHSVGGGMVGLHSPYSFPQNQLSQDWGEPMMHASVNYTGYDNRYNNAISMNKDNQQSSEHIFHDFVDLKLIQDRNAMQQGAERKLHPLMQHSYSYNSQSTTYLPPNQPCEIQTSNLGFNGHETKYNENSAHTPYTANQHSPETTPEVYDQPITRCSWGNCSLEAHSQEQLVTHILDDHIGTGKASYTCEWRGCSRMRKPFTKRHKIQNHVRIHTGERPFPCPVADCGKRFSRQDGLLTHIKTHSNVKPFICSHPSCKKAYFHSRSLKKHVRSHQEQGAQQQNVENLGSNDLNQISGSRLQLDSTGQFHFANVQSVQYNGYSNPNYTPAVESANTDGNASGYLMELASLTSDKFEQNNGQQQYSY